MSNEKDEMTEEEIIDEFDLEALIVEGKDANIIEEIEFFNIKSQKKARMKVNIRPISRGKWSEFVRASTKKKSTKELEELVCAECWLDPDGMPIELSKIRKMQKGAVTAVYEKIKYISGIFNDPFEEKFIDKLANF